MSGSSAPVPNVYLGTSEFAAGVLRALAASPHRPALVVTPPDRPRGRGRRLGTPPAAEAARELGIDVLQASSVNDPETARAVLASGPAVACVCEFGQLIGEPLLSELPMLNVHPSLLPRWRGAAPIERAIMAGDERTGVCVMRVTEGLDSGPVALREELTIGDDEDHGSLAGRLAALGGELLVEAVGRWGAGTLEFEEQPEEGVTYAEKIGPGDRRIDPRRSAAEVSRTIRALTPHIGAFAMLAGDERLGLRAARPDGSGAPAGGEFAAVGDLLLLGCSDGAISIGEVQPPGGRWMAAADYLRGRGVPPPVAWPEG